MNNIVNKLMMSIILIIINRSFSQELSNGTIDFIFQPSNNWLQVVIWLENNSGEYIETVYITNFIGRYGGGNRTSNPDIDLSNGNRLSAFPIWAHNRSVIDTTFGIENYYPPDQDQTSYPDDIDAVSGATSSQSVQTKTLQLSNLPYGIYNCWIEVNRSYDFNDYHNYSFYRGQPSLVWMVSINISDSPDSNSILDYTGYGSPDGSDGNINAPNSTITTAANLLSDLGDYKFKAIYKSDPVNVIDNFTDFTQVHCFTLNQNYPNPFNPETTIEYHIAEPGKTSITIYNILGEIIEIFDEGFQNIGNYYIIFNGGKHPSGVYYYKIKSGNFSEIKSMVLLK